MTGGLQCHRTSEANQGRLGSDVVDAVHRCPKAVDRRHVDDATEIPPAHVAKHKSRRVEGGRKIDRERTVPVLHAKLLDGGEVSDDSIVDQNVDATEGLIRRVDHGGNLVWADKVSAMMQGANAVIDFKLAAHALDFTRIAEAVQYDVAALGGQSRGHREP